MEEGTLYNALQHDYTGSTAIFSTADYSIQLHTRRTNTTNAIDEFTADSRGFTKSIREDIQECTGGRRLSCGTILRTTFA